MNNRTTIIQQYFNMWLTKNSTNLSDIFASNIHYVECYGAEYIGINEMRQWIVNKFKTQTVTQWDIKNIYHEENIFTVEWTFACIDDGQDFKFDGVSLITFTNGYITEVKEFESKYTHYRPYSS